MKPIPRAITMVAGIFAAVFMPRVSVTPTAWAAAHFVLPDGPYAGQKFNPEITPYLREPLDFFADEVAANKAVIRKSKQTGFSTAAIIACGFSIVEQPCDLFLIEPTSQSLDEFISEKFNRAVELTPAIGDCVRAQTSRSGAGSTTYSKKFGSYSLLLGVASSTADLRGKTRKKIIKDEASEYEADLDGQGSPHDMIAGAYESFLAGGEWKELDISTPVIEGGCYITAEFNAGDQRYWTMPCPGCGAGFAFEFNRKNFIFKDAYPHKAHYVTPCCGSVIEPHEKNALVRKGEWFARAPAPGKHRSYHFDALSSPFVPWDTIAARYVAAGDDQIKLKTFNNLTLGLAFEMKGDAPDHVRLLERREDYGRGAVPPDGLLLVAGADVQHSGIWFEIFAAAPDGQTWSIDHSFLPGDTTDPRGGAFAALAEVYERKFPDAFGGLRELDAMAVDAGDGGRANQVYLWTRSRNRAFAIKGVPGWSAPAIGTPTRVSINLAGKKIEGGAMLWPVGTWTLKSTYYDNLRKDGRKAGAETDPPGYCHHHADCDENYFKQQTAEYLDDATFRGRSVKVWRESGPNHLLDCRVYGMAMLEYLGISRMTADQWALLRKQRGAPAELKAPDLLAPDSVKLAADGAEAAPIVKPALLNRKPKGRGRRVVSRGIA